MVAQKRKRRAAPPTETQEQESKPSEKPALPPTHQRFTIWDYVFVNLFFWVFCWLQRTVAGYLNGDDMGLDFFFYTMAIGFTVVSIVAFVHDLLSGEIAKEPEV